MLTTLPKGLEYENFKGGTYARFVLTGPYSDLPEASGQVFKIVAKKQIPMREDYCIENYVNDPRMTSEKELVTHILVPTL